jgi:hypothetical protein
MATPAFEIRRLDERTTGTTVEEEVIFSTDASSEARFPIDESGAWTSGNESATLKLDLGGRYPSASNCTISLRLESV